ncbi:hypothetical protein [Leifsonia shinshuensis]|uniref:Uncharacterized protein n=1 Tax=Leifsonia shinshuensis TaxID=150026 RepID=A0A853CVY3_9MICO|nr:hypothetical protein [Leifsonia shinshuensis]NYJ24439.1 hypothetical protein [Leifsonia shinshuensis]
MDTTSYYVWAWSVSSRTRVAVGTDPRLWGTEQRIAEFGQDGQPL